MNKPVRTAVDAGSSAEANNPFVFDKPKPVASKAAAPKSEAPKPASDRTSGMPDFSALAAEAPAASAPLGFPNLVVSGSKPAKPSKPQPVAEKPKAADSKVIRVDVPAAKVAEKPVAVEKPKPVEKKSTAVAAELAGFREFAAIAGSATSPVVVAPKPTTMPAAAPSSSETAAVPQSAAPASENTSAVVTVFGQGWIPAVTDGTASLLFATAIYQGYAAFTGGLNIATGTAVVAGLIAAGVTMLAISLALRLLTRIAGKATRPCS